MNTSKYAHFTLILILLLVGLLAACQSTPVSAHPATIRNHPTQPPTTTTVSPRPPTSTLPLLHQAMVIGFEGESVYGVAIDPLTPTTLYATTVGGVFKSTNGGKNWRTANTGLTYLDVCCLAIDPLTPTTLYAISASEVFKSTDGGANWNNSHLSWFNVNFLAIDPLTPTTFYAGAQAAGIYKTTDGGQNWHEANTGFTNTEIRAIAIDPAMSSRLYASTPDGIFKSVDGGKSWRMVGYASHDSPNTLAVDLLAPNTLYAGTDHYLLKSVDGGITWVILDTGLKDVAIYELAIDPAGPDGALWLSTGNGIFYFEDKP